MKDLSNSDIVIIVQDGKVQSVYSKKTPIVIDVADYDAAQENDTVLELAKALSNVYFELYRVL